MTSNPFDYSINLTDFKFNQDTEMKDTITVNGVKYKKVDTMDVSRYANVKEISYKNKKYFRFEYTPYISNIEWWEQVGSMLTKVTGELYSSLENEYNSQHGINFYNFNSLNVGGGGDFKVGENIRTSTI